LRAELPVGREVQVSLSRRGYAETTRSFSIDSAGRRSETVSLEPQPLLWRSAVGERFTYKAAAGGQAGRQAGAGAVYFADRAGTLYAVTSEGSVRWSIETENQPNENSIPVLAGSQVFLSGSAALVAVDAADGEVAFRRGFSGSASHLFGQRVLPYEDVLYVPANREITVVQRSGSEAGSESGALSLPAKSLTTPALHEGSVVTVTNRGEVVLLDSESGNTQARIGTPAVQPVAVKPVIAGDRAVFADRRGRVVAVDLAAGEVAWDRSIGSEGVFHDVVVAGSIVYARAGGTLHALALADGEAAFDPVENVSSLPLVRNGTLYYGRSDGSDGSNGALVVASADDGSILKTLEFNAKIVTQPVWMNESVVVGLADGSVAAIYAPSIP
jgi:outer membrane protein assembly factor BamB